MSMALALLCRAVRRRFKNGETLADILADYPKLTEAEKTHAEAAYIPNEIAASHCLMACGYFRLLSDRDFVYVQCHAQG